ncbi:NaeI family type II restriction endonuclease [Herbiconiux sp. CPCC 205763]|uniref:NaeI family type II restriction endonuclease n=1 Tax=Herbiconiux aconitum TaxID=2970913 RepID=A0ABT2GYJ3_9MICO|nr:NaeI family type II restriction endonuclease [Herbiconiux aconitum]MCS5720031.1 NaeI family type II restriction endonuclease [Herbiconiux aconitum]
MSNDEEVTMSVVDLPLEAIAEELLRLDPDGSRWGSVIRHTFDMIYNGQETGRYKWDELMKTEKTHFGSLFEINAQREFSFEGGAKLDFFIEGYEVDAKWSQSMGGWMLPPEVFDQIALVGTADDAESRWSIGLVRVSEVNRRDKTNRDQKSQLSLTGRAAIKWLWREAQLPPNVLLQLPEDVVTHILDSTKGTQRLHRLFRAAEGRIVHRTTVATVARQLDAQKRVRGNGGSRSVLASEGIVILSGKYHAHIAKALAVPVPSATEYISVRVVPSTDGSGAIIAGERWRRAKADDVVVKDAPQLPERGTVEELDEEV